MEAVGPCDLVYNYARWFRARDGRVGPVYEIRIKRLLSG